MLSELRKIKSFVCRQGRVTVGQQHALHDLLPIYSINYQTTAIDLGSAFGRNNPKVIEIGFGMGHATWQIAKDNPECDYLGIEVHTPGVGSLLMFARDNQLHNLRVIQHDAVEVLHHMIADNSISGFHIFFPDPWPKKRHHKRRIIQSEFINLLGDKLKTGAYVHIATDWEDYANWIIDVFKTNSRFIHELDTNNTRPLTKFEQRGMRLGHQIWDFYFKKVS